MAGAHGEAVLRYRICGGAQCRAVFFICSQCDRGHCYCSPACRDQARLQSRRASNKRHQQSPEGRLDHNGHQREYRRRCREKQARVTDQGSISINSPASSECGPAEATAEPETPPAPRLSPDIQPAIGLRCRVCGRAGRFIDPYPRIPRKRWLPHDYR